MLRRGPSSRPGSAPAPAPAAAAPSPATLPPPPDGYAYAWNETHRQFLLVQVALPLAAAPQPSRLVGPGGQPLGSPSGAPGSMANGLLRQGVDSEGNAVDKYHEYLAGLRDLDPSGTDSSGRPLLYLLPPVEEAERLYPTPRAMVPEYDGQRDPFGGRQANLRIGAEGAPVPPGPSTNPNAPPVVASGE